MSAIVIYESIYGNTRAWGARLARECGMRTEPAGVTGR
jgi:hypothetical protein